MGGPQELLTLGLAAVRLGAGVQHHHLHRLARRGLIPHFFAGRLRLVAVADLPTIRAACAKAGYIQIAQPETVAHAR